MTKPSARAVGAAAPPAMLVAFQRCGCLVAACKLECEADALQWLRDGLTVRTAEWAEWRESLLPRFLEDCPHKPEDLELANPPSLTGDATQEPKA